MSDREIVQIAMADGWECRQVSLYDEEAVEGFEWKGPNGEECSSHAVDGDWTAGPEVPEAVRLAVDPGYRAEAEEKSREKRAFADFLNRLLLK